MDSKTIANGSQDGTVSLWGVESGEPVQGLNPIKTGHKSAHAVSYSPKTTKNATGGYSEDGIKIWGADGQDALNDQNQI